MEISRPNDLGHIANLGLTLPEAKQLLDQGLAASSGRDPVWRGDRGAAAVSLH
jgi:hypothetical protein